MYKDFHELDIWRDGYNLLMEIYNISDSFNETERYALTVQIRRSANSIIANIAEAHGRYNFPDKIRVLYIARGEIVETRSHLAVAFGRCYINKENFIKLNENYKKLTKNLNLYINNLNNNKK